GILLFSLGKQKPSIKGSSILLEKLRSICVKKSLTTKLDIVPWLSSQAFSCHNLPISFKKGCTVFFKNKSSPYCWFAWFNKVINFSSSYIVPVLIRSAT